MPEALKVTLPSALDAGVDFPKLNELRIQCKTVVDNSIVRLNIYTGSATDITLSGNSKFYSDSAGTTLIGNKVTTGIDVQHQFYIKASGDFYISVANKYAIKQLGYIFIISNIAGAVTGNVFSTIKTKDLKFISSLTKVQGNSSFSGDVNDFSKGLTTVNAPYLSNNPDGYLYGTFSKDTFNKDILTELVLTGQTKLTGEFKTGVVFNVLSSLQVGNTNLTGVINSTIIKTANMTDFNILNTNIAVDLSFFAGKTITGTFSLSGSLAKGDVQNLASINKTSLENLKGIELTGDLAKLNNNCVFLSNAGGTFNKNDNSTKTSLTWTTKGTRQYILALENVRMTSGVDQFLIDMSTLELDPSAIQSGSSWLKTIRIIGTRTSASDSAVATLSAKGVTVTLLAS